jgi:hypothetical protein
LYDPLVLRIGNVGLIFISALSSPFIFILILNQLLVNQPMAFAKV